MDPTLCALAMIAGNISPRERIPIHLNVLISFLPEHALQTCLTWPNSKRHLTGDSPTPSSWNLSVFANSCKISDYCLFRSRVSVIPMGSLGVNLGFQPIDQPGV